MAVIRKFFVLVLIIWPCQGHSQRIKIADLRKYSYRLETTDSKYPIGSYVDNGTAFLLCLRKHLYLVTNYHLLLTRNALTGKYLVSPDFKPDTVRVYFHKKKNEMQTVGLSYSLYDSIGEPKFMTMKFDAAKYCDIAILPIEKIPDTLATYIICNAFFDSTTTKAWPHKKLVIAGFPLAKGDTDNYAQVFTAYSIAPPGGNSPYLFYDTKMDHGASGSPIFIVNNDTGELTLIAINAEGPPIGDTHFEYGGGGIYLKYALDIISGIKPFTGE
jgi:hypothetical protein